MMRAIRTAVARRCAALVVALVLAPLPLALAIAQEQPLGVELRPFLGAYFPMGTHADLLKTGSLVGFQLALRANRYVAVVGTAAWLPNGDRTASVDQAVDLYQYDVGAEAGMSRSLGTGAVVRPFLGLGLGGRTFGYRDREPDPQHNIATYGAAGGQVQMGRLGLRVEARGYITGFKGLTGELTERKTRKDVTIATGLAVAL